MGLDFDVIEFCRKLRLDGIRPPYKCPVEKCDRTYKSTCGMQYHLVNYDHDNPQPLTPSATPARKKGRSRPAVPTADLTICSPKEPLTYAESQKIVQFEIDGKVARISINEPIEAMSFDESDQRSTFAPVEAPPEPIAKLPEPSFRVLPDYSICDAPARPNAYIRFIEKSAEELDGEVEYDVDEEDTAWLGIINERRRNQGLPAVSVDSLELLMDRLEKESFFQAAQTGQGSGVVDDDAVCCICMDGECQNTNVILFCDMCNLAVHQDCYGVPYIPEGQWLCRRCLQSPSRPVDCVLCPNTGGAFKQTDRGHWAHVVCALWIPEVRFANTVFLEPIDSIESIPPARWKLSCYVCKQRGVGACIQCHRNNCYAAFHVTCAQHAGLYMRMDTVNRETEGQPVMVQKTAYCDAHTPHGAQDPGDRGNKAREESRMKMKQARRLLAKKRTSVPVILIPTIPPERVQEIASLVSIPKKPQFIQRLIAYWTLKRHYRNGVPLLRRLQSQGSGGGRALTDSVADMNELMRQHKYWQCLRQDLERARLLCELVRKREKLKAALIRIKERCMLCEINPLDASMDKLLDLLQAKDTAQIFIEPVDPTEVPDYSAVVTHPMDLSTMKSKLENGQYPSLDVMEDDFNLMIANCLAYNSRDTVFYRHGVRMRDQGSVLFKSARKELESLGIIQSEADKLLAISMEVEKPVVQEKNISVKVDVVAKDIDSEYQEIMESVPVEKRQARLEILLEKTKSLKHGAAKNKRLKIIRAEIKKFQQAANAPSVTDSSQSDAEIDASVNEATVTPLKQKTTSSSPSGINRRDAVLFSRKMQAALKKTPEPSTEEGGDNDMECETEIDNVIEKTPKTPDEVPSTKSSGKRGRRSKGSSRKNQSKEMSDGKSKPVSESFLVYRGRQEDAASDSESLSDSSSIPCSTSCSHGSKGSNSHSSEYDDTSDSECDTDHDMNEDLNQSKPSLEPLQLVWAKCRGYPWYPALIIDPETPRGFVHNGVPLPAPPSDVLTLRKNNLEPVLFLVLFFDAKRTWQWLPPNKLELLGLQKSLDQSKLVESRKPADRKAVKKAYQDALLYQSQVTDAQGPGAIM